MKWWQKRVRGWTVPFWFTWTPIYSKLYVKLSKFTDISKAVSDQRNGKNPQGLLTFDKELTKEQLDELKKAFKESGQIFYKEEKKQNDQSS